MRRKGSFAKATNSSIEEDARARSDGIIEER